NIDYYKNILRDRSVSHPQLCQEIHAPKPAADASSNIPFTFVIGADTQLGSLNEWETELQYCEKAIRYINSMETKPAFVCMCGDLVDMHADLFPTVKTKEWRDQTQREQFHDFQSVWKKLNPTIPLVCLCGNHDVGNQPTKGSIDNYKSFFGDDYFAFWCNSCYFVCVNSNIYFDNSNVEEEYALQHAWLEERLQYACDMNARKIFLCGHHPWFLYDENETAEALTGINSFMARGEEHLVPDAYFSVPPSRRAPVLALCKQYGVTACFSGHYHQNLVSRTSWGMPVIVTGAICNILLKSDAKDLSNPLNVTPAAGVRVVTVDEAACDEGFVHSYEPIC
ncbi:unnamed protein product, partial [Ectocarpus fasciculatus]